MSQTKGCADDISIIVILAQVWSESKIRQETATCSMWVMRAEHDQVGFEAYYITSKRKPKPWKAQTGLIIAPGQTLRKYCFNYVL